MADLASTGSTGSTRFGEVLRRARQAAGLTQEELAERAGLSRRGIADLEGGARQTPRKDTVALLADALGLAGENRTAFEAAARRATARHVQAPSAASPPTAGSGGAAPSARPLPTGTVTFLFTDIEGSTRLLQQLGSERYAALEAEHHRLVRTACAAHGGCEVDTAGDGFFVVFPTAHDALAAAAQTQRALAGQPWPEGVAVLVRMGLHTGAPIVAGDNYVGLDVHRAARIAAAGHGGQVLLSQTTRALVEDALPAGASVRDLGAHRLKDLQRSERLFQLVLPDLPADFPPLNALDVHLHNLPVQLTSFVGRERELAELKPLLLASRLLTLTGPGGTGKTRLALPLAANVLDRFADGVWLVELAPLADPTLVPNTVAAVLGVREQPGQPILDVLLDALRPKTLLLILDNCEHLIATCAQVAETLLRAAPNVHILASSREALGIAGETAYRVPSLPLPDPVPPGQPGHPRTRAFDLAALARNDCVRLFVERAAAVSPSFCLTAKNAPAIAQISRRLDGIPLALELAAARTRVFPPHQIVARLDDRFRLLTGGSRTALPRHQTLLALIEWSHELLNEAERMLLRRLSVFAGGWSFEAAQAVCGEGLDEEVLETLAHLADKSLIDVEAPMEAAEGRYHLLETIRQYARDKLLASGEAQRVRDRHLEYFVQFAEEAEPHLRAAEQLAWLGRVEREHDNLRAALAWALESGKRENALRLAGALYYFWELRGYWSEGQKWVDDALALSAGQQSGRATAGPVGESGPPTREPTVLRAKALYAAARMYFGAQLDMAGSRTLVEESLGLWREVGDKWWMAVALEHVAFVTFAEDFQTSTARVEEGVALAREVQDRWPLGLCLGRLAYARAAVGDMAAARRMCEEYMAIARSVGDKSQLSMGLGAMAPFYWLEGNLAAAASIAEEALGEARAIGGVTQVFLSLFMLIFTACLQSDLAKAREYCVQVVAYTRETGGLHWLMLGLIGFGTVACFGGQAERGVRLLASAETPMRQRGMDHSKLGPGFMVIGQALDKAREQLGPAAFESAWTAGLGLTMEQALALAMERESEEAPLPVAGRGPDTDAPSLPSAGTV
jgi:predicted ATPase/class 3 adenylate cyclase